MTETSKAFVFFPAEIKLLKKLLSLDLDALGLSSRDKVLAESSLRTLEGKPPDFRPRKGKRVKGNGTPVQIRDAREIADGVPPPYEKPREIIVSDVEGALFELMSRRGR